MRKPKNSKVTIRTLDKEVIEIETDTDEDCGKALALCSQVSAGRGEQDHQLTTYGENNRAGKQIVCADGDCDAGYLYELEYLNYLVNYTQYHPYFLDGNVAPMRLMFDVGEASHRKKGKPGRKPKTSSIPRVSKWPELEKKKPGRKPKAPSLSSVPKKLKIENGRAYHKSVWVKEKSKRGRKAKRLETENGRADHNSSWRTEKTQRKIEELRRGRKKGGAKEKSNVKSHTTLRTLRASKRLKRSDHNSIPLVESESLLNSEETLALADESYADYLRNYSITISTQDQQVKDLACVSVSDSDIIAISDHPFSDGGHFPFEANKDEKVIDLEDNIEECNDIFNSTYCKKLIEILRKPYDEKEYLKLYIDAKLKKPKMRSRQLRDGREIEYNVDSELALSYLEKYPDLEKKFRRYQMDLPRALNLLRGLFFYLQNVAHEGQFQPWEYEHRLESML